MVLKLPVCYGVGCPPPTVLLANLLDMPLMTKKTKINPEQDKADVQQGLSLDN